MLRKELPAGMDLPQQLDKKGITELLQQLAEKHPDSYVDVLHNLNQLGAEVATTYGNEASFSLNDLRTPPAVKLMRDKLRADIHKITQSGTLTPDQKNEEILKYLTPKIKDIHKQTLDEAVKAGNSFAIAVKHGIRGSPAQLNQLLTGDLLNADNRGRAVPVPGLRSYSEGLTPAEAWGSGYSSRAGYASVQFATAKTGFFGKQMATMEQNLRVTGDDCGASEAGIPVKGDDSDLLGRTLLRTTNGVPAGKMIEKRDLDKLKDTDDVWIRSPTTCKQPEGVCRKCLGRQPDGKLPEIGAFVGIDSARTLSEPMTQTLGLCLDPETEVRMSDWSVKLLRDICKGDWVMGVDTQNFLLPVRVLNVWHNSSEELYSFTYKARGLPEEGLNLIASAKHQILSRHLVRPDHKGMHKYESVMKEAGKTTTPMVVVNMQFLAGKPFYYSWNPARRTSVEDTGRKDSMDIEVNHPTHRFLLANGLVVSNSAKHVGGQVGVNSGYIQGFDEINQFLQIPHVFRSAATLAPVDGRVEKITPAPQGGTYLTVGGVQVYAPRGIDPEVKVGETVEAGDTLTTGTPNPAEVVKHKGLGEGRVYFTRKLAEILKRNDVATNNQHVELAAKGFLDRVRIMNPEGVAGHDFGAVVPYGILAHDWKPREGTTKTRVKDAVGRYLEKPSIYYTIGTKVTPKVAQRLTDAGIALVDTHADSPGFEPEVTRLMDMSSKDRSWKARLGGFGLKRSFTNAAQMGAESTPDSPNPVPWLMNPIGEL